MADLLKKCANMNETERRAIQKDFQELKKSLQIEIERGNQLTAERRELKVRLQASEIARGMAADQLEKLEEEYANLTGELNIARRKIDDLENGRIGHRELIAKLRNANVELKGKFEGALQAVERMSVAS